MMESQLTAIFLGVLLIAIVGGSLLRYVWWYVMFKFFADDYVKYPAWKAALFMTIFLKK